MFKPSLLLIILITLFSCTTDDDMKDIKDANCIDTNCIDYTSQAKAQAAFDADPECRNDLDRDHDGIACEEPGNSVADCPSTSNCGCSGHNKAPCKSDPCCKWIVGSGCECK